MLRKITITVIVVTVFFLIGLGVYENIRGVYSAEGKSSALPKLHYEVTILPDGSSRVDEYRTYEFIKGPFSRGFLEIDGKITDVKVAENNQSYKKLDGFSNSRPPGHYAVNEKSMPARIEWYYTTKDKEIRTFQASYTVKASSTLYNDCVDYFQKYLSSKNVYKIKNFSVIVHLPPGADQSNTKIWAHGPAGGNISYKDDSIVELTMKNVPSGQYIEARILLPPNVLPRCETRVNANKYEELLREENNAAQKSDRERLVRGSLTILSLAAALVLALLPIIFRITYQRGLKRYTPQLAPRYYRELPSDISPAELDYLVNYLTGKANTSRQMSATILDLIYRGVLKAENKEVQGLLLNKKDTVLIFHNSDPKKLEKHEMILLEFLFGQVGRGEQTVSLSQVEKYCANKRTAQSAYSFYVNFEQKVSAMVQGRGYFETKKNALPKRIQLLLPLYLFLMVGPMVLTGMVKPLAGSPIYIISIGGVIGFFIYITIGPKKKNMFTQKGEDHNALWQAFKDFLADFTTFEEKELPELFIWEKYLVYAAVLGVADKLLQQLFMRYPQLASEEYLRNTSLMYAMDMRGFNQASHSLERIGEALGSAMRSAVNVTSRSSQGSGGGFSSGGSSSGGGSGGSSGGVN